ncbi:MAG: outer membrane beta-barrel protein [Mariprofundaceae bacterium]
MKFYRFLIAVFAIVLSFTSMPAQAIDFEPYAGGGYGGFLIDAGLGSGKTAGGYGILGADLHENYGVELRFGNIGGYSAFDTPVAADAPPVVAMANQVLNDPIITTAPSPVEIDIDWFISYLFKLQFPVDENFNVYGLIGGTTMHSNIYFKILGRTGHTTKTSLSYGGGIDYKVGDQWLLGLDAMVYSNDANTNPGTNFSGLDVWGLTATMKYKF